MKTYLKPLGIVAAVAAVTAGYAGVANAQVYSPSGSPEVNVGNIGDLAIIPYYTVQDDWITGVHIINTSDRTQIVKLRLRRAKDSADALDFNLIMSPFDEWTGFIDDSSGNIVFATDDNTCTAPIRADGRFEMPAIFRAGAEEGYIEVIGMGSADYNLGTGEPIAIASKHGADGVPADCAAVESNFFAGGIAITRKGNIDSDDSIQAVANVGAYVNASTTCIPANIPANAGQPGLCTNDYNDSDNALAVSYFYRDAAAGAEMGGNAVHVRWASDNAWMTNQQTGLFSGDVRGFDYPDLNGGPLLLGDRGLFNQLRSPNVLGVTGVLNDWSVATARNVSTDWVVTMPGQYTMLDFVVWAAQGFEPANCAKLDDPNTAIDDGVPQCDFRDIPVLAFLDLWNREEGEILSEEGDLVISPAPPGEVNVLTFPYEVNVVEWTDGNTTPVLGSDYATSVNTSVLGEFGWARLAVLSAGKAATQGGVQSGLLASPQAATIGASPIPGVQTGGQAVCNFNTGSVATDSHEQRAENTGVPGPYIQGVGDMCIPATGAVPIVGFVAWQRSFPQNPDGNYARLIDHSFTSM